MQQRKKKQFDLYGYADLIFNTLQRRYIGLFNRLKNLPESERAVIEEVNKVYEEVDLITRKYLLLLAKKIYKEIMDLLDSEDVVDTITELWIFEQLKAYDPVTKYVYIHEVDRKRARTIESIIASSNKVQEVENAKKQFSKQAKQYADNIVAKTIEKAYEDKKVLEVVWETEEDLRVCPKCEEYGGNVYRLEDVPEKPHYGCRCWLTPYEIWIKE